MRLIDADALIEIAKENAPAFNWDALTVKSWFIAVLQSENIAPTVEPKRGKWVERRVSYVPDSDIYEMQSAKCSACGLYHTTPYQYVFKDYKFCPHCGAKMERSENND